MTVAQLPTEDPASRMRVLRTLESLGAAVMREGVYLLPDTPANRHVARARSAEYIVKSAGIAHVLQRRAPPRRAAAGSSSACSTAPRATTT